jgi:hypothetical protein
MTAMANRWASSCQWIVAMIVAVIEIPPRAQR